MDHSAQRSTAVVLLAVALTVASAPGHAQSWYDKLKDSVGLGEESTELSQSTLTDGLKEALSVASERVVDQLGQEGGFNADPTVHIPLPDQLNRAQSLLERAGFGGYGDELELRLNRAAEAAVPEAKDLFVDAIQQMTVADAKDIVTGPDDAATQYFQQTMTPGLRERMSPIIDNALAQVGAVQRYDQFMSQYQNLPMVPDVKANLTDYTLGQALDGVFHYMAAEEAAIRNNPAKRTTELLKKVFGGK